MPGQQRRSSSPAARNLASFIFPTSGKKHDHAFSAIAFDSDSETVVLGDHAGLLTLHVDSVETHQAQVEGSVQAIGMGKSKREAWIAVAVDERAQAGALKVFTADTLKLKLKLAQVHRTSSTSLMVSPSSPSFLVSVSSSELLMYNTSDWSCILALRGPSPSTISPSFYLTQAVWIPRLNSSLPPAFREILGLWDSGEFCLWQTPYENPVNDVKLEWRAGPKETAVVSGFKALAAVSDDGSYLFTTSAVGNSEAVENESRLQLLAWDVEERVLVHRYLVDLAGEVSSLFILNCTFEEAELLICADSTLFFLPLTSDPSGSFPIPLPSFGRISFLTNGGLGGFAFVTSGGSLKHTDITEIKKEAAKNTKLSTKNIQTSSNEHQGGVNTTQVPLVWKKVLSQPGSDIQRRSLSRMIAEEGSCRFELRASIYCALLRCPSSSEFFRLVALEEDSKLLAKFRAEWVLDDWQAQTRMESLIHLLSVHGLPADVLLDRIPPLIHGFVLALPESVASPQELFEITLTVIQRWGRIWWDKASENRRDDLWRLIAEAIGTERGSDVFSRTGVAIQKCVASVAFGLMNGFLEMKDWLIVFDNVVARSPLYFVSVLVAIFDLFKPELDQLENADAVRAFFQRPHSVNVKLLLRKANVLHEKLRRSEIALQIAQKIPEYGTIEVLDDHYSLRQLS